MPESQRGPSSSRPSDAHDLGFAPATPDDWALPPDTVGEALDRILSSGGGILVTAGAVISDLVIPCGDGGARGLKEGLSGETLTLGNGVRFSINPGGTITQPLRVRTAGAGNTLKEHTFRSCSNTSGAGGTGLGLYEHTKLENDASALVDATRVEEVWDDGSAGAENASKRVQVAVAGSLTEIFRADKDGLLIAGSDKVRLRDDDIFMHSDADASAIFESDGAMLLRGLTGTTIGVAGDIVLGDSTLRVMYPQTDGKIDLGKAGNTFNDLHLSGDVFFTGAGSGLTYGEIYAVGNTTETTIAASGKANKVQVTIFDTDGPSNNATPDHTNDHITIVTPGIYMITCCIHADSVAGAAAEFGWSIYKNNGATEIVNLHAHRDFAGGGGEAGAANICGMATLAATDTIELWCWNEGGTQNLVNADVGISVVKIGGT